MPALFCRDPTRSLIELVGLDCESLLQGLVTNDVKQATIETPIYAAMLTPKGRFFADLFIIPTEETFLLDCPTDQVSEIIKKLGFYKLRSDVQIKDVSDTLKVGLLWDGAPSEIPECKVLFKDPRLAALGYRTIIPEGLEIPEAPWEHYNAHRLHLGIPMAGTDMIVDKTIPLEAGLDDLKAINFDKGCYLGQELTARTKHQGLVRKRLFPIEVDGEFVEGQFELTLNGDVVGDVRSHQGKYGVAMIRLEAFQDVCNSNVSLKAGETLIRPFKPSWMVLDQS